MTYLWLVLQYREPKFEIQGIFSKKELAVSACKSDQFGVFRMELDKELPIETFEDGYFWYPWSEEEPT